MARCDSVDYLPVGFKFHPTDEELLGYYLLNKLRGQSFMYENVVPEIDLYGHKEPCEIWNEYGGQKLKKGEDLYFFTKLKKVCSKGSRVARTIGSGTWKGENSGTEVRDPRNEKMKLGLWKRFKYENTKSDKNGWIMYEYSPDPTFNPKSNSSSGAEEELVLCRIRKNDKKRKLSDVEEDNEVEETPVRSQTKIQRQQVTSSDELVGSCSPMSSDVNEVIPQYYSQQQEQKTTTTTTPDVSATYVPTGFSHSQPNFFTADVPNMVSSLACVPQPESSDYVELNENHQPSYIRSHCSQLDNGYDIHHSCQLGTPVDDNITITESFTEQPPTQFGNDQNAELNASHFNPDDFLKLDEDDALQVPLFLGMEGCTATAATEAKGNKITEGNLPNYQLFFDYLMNENDDEFDSLLDAGDALKNIRG